MTNLKPLLSSKRDDWETPQDLFDRLNKIHHFTLDPCSTHENAKCAKHYTKADNGLEQSWKGESVFCNPPYGRDIAKWVKKAAQESEHAKIVMLIPARTDTKYFHEYIYKKPNVKVEFLKGRLKFELGGHRQTPHRSHLCLYILRKNNNESTRVTKATRHLVSKGLD